MILLVTLNLAMVLAGPATDPSYKDQYCTDPRTMNKHAAYTEWADAYSCTRHRCQPGGRNLAIYTVGCKRVEAPESAIECEEVVEDTNMQFPFCCTRLRCLVVVRGEVWTKVLGQPWETLPAAPWSHMYKMKKPPPGDTVLPKSTNEGPVYELTSDTENEDPHKQVLRASSKNEKDCPEGNDGSPRAAIATPDIVIALTTTSEQKDHDKDFKKADKSEKRSGRKRSKKTPPVGNLYLDEETPEQHHDMDNEETYTEKLSEGSEEKFYGNNYGAGVTQKEPSKNQQSWTEIPPAQWSEHDLDESSLLKAEEKSFHQQPEYQPEPEKQEKPSNLQALVDAIGTRMRDIENVVQKMSEKVHQAKPAEPEQSAEKRAHQDASLRSIAEGLTKWLHSVVTALSLAVDSSLEDEDIDIIVLSEPEIETFKHRKETKDHSKEYKAKRPSADGDQYKRFTVRKSASKYLHGATDVTTEVPLFIEDNSMNGYFSDASNSVLRRGSHSPPKEPALTYMAPVDNNRRKAHIVPTESDESDKKHKKHAHKKKHGKGKNHKKHKDDKRKRFNRLNSSEIDKNVVSLEDSSAVVKK